MAESRTQTVSTYRPIRAPRGPSLSCKGWQQEAALRMLTNSLDPAIAEHPEQLIVSGGIGKLARDWPAFHAIVNSLQSIEDADTLIIHSGAPGPMLKTNPDAPRVLVVNSAVSPPWQDSSPAERERGIIKPTARMAADWMFTGPSSALPETYETFRAAAHKHFGGSLAGRLVVAGGMGGIGGAQTLAATLNGGAFLGIEIDPERIKRRLKAGYCQVMVNNLDEALRILKNAVRKRAPTSVGLIGNTCELLPEFARRGILPDLLTDQTPTDDPFAYIPQGLALAQSAELREHDPLAYREQALDSIAAQLRAMVELKKMGSVVFEFGNAIRAQGLARGVTEAYEIPDFASEYLLPELAQGRGLLTIVALSGDPGDLTQVDDLIAKLFAGSRLPEWIAMARKRPSPGLPARSCWIAADDATKLGAAINDLVARAEIKAPVVMGRSIRQKHAKNLPTGQPEAPAPNSAASSDPLEDSPERTELLYAARGASWFSVLVNSALNQEPHQEWKQSSSFAMLADGKPKAVEHIERLFANDFAAAVSSFAAPRQR